VDPSDYLKPHHATGRSSAAGECQANAKKLFEIQDSIWAEIVDTSESTEGTQKSPDS
jgi:hypothetical protein